MICHTGGAIGSDSYFESISKSYGFNVNAYSYKTNYHNSNNKVEISEEDYHEGIVKIKEANKILKRSNIEKYMNLLSRNWAQVKYSSAIIAIGAIILPNDINSQGYKNKAKIEVVDGGTGYAVMMGILETKLIYVFDQNKEQWYKWSYVIGKFITCDIPVLPEEITDFAGIGTRQLNNAGSEAINNFFKVNFYGKYKENI